MITNIHIRRILLLVMGLFLFTASTSFAAKKPEVIKYDAQYLDRAISINVQWQSASPVIFVRVFAGKEQKEIKVDEYDNKRTPYGYTGEVTVVVKVEPAFFQESVGYSIQLEDDIRQKSNLITGKVAITPSVAEEREDDSFGKDRAGVLPGGQRDTKSGDIVDKLIGVMERHDAAPYLDKIKVNILSAENVNFTTKATDDKGLRDITFRILDGAGNIAGEEVLTNLGKVWQGTTKTFTLKAENYRIVAQAIDTAGNTSKERSESFKVSGVMPLHGSLTVNIMPEAAVKAGAQWRLAKGEWQNSGAVGSKLPQGAHNIEFKDIANFVKPANKSVSIQAGQTTAETASYSIEDPKTGSLNVIITPDEVKALGAKWSIDGTNWHEAGKTIDIAIGTYTVKFSEAKGWETPAPQTVEIAAKGITPAQGNYKKKVQGLLTVMIIPQAVIEYGAQWRVNSGEWQKSGVSVSLSHGQHTVDFKDVQGWNKPANQVVTIQIGQATTVTGDYPPPASSALQGACVMRDSYTSMPLYSAQDNGKGYSMRKLGPVQSYDDAKAKCTDSVFQQLTVSYCQSNSNSTQWGVATFDSNGNVKTSGCAQSGCDFHACSAPSIRAMIEPAGAVSAGAQWRVTGGAWQGSGATVSGLSAGQHTIEFKEVTGWGRPQNQTVTVIAGKVTEVKGAYQQQVRGTIPDSNTVLLDNFNGTIKGMGFGNFSYKNSLPNLGQAVNLTKGVYIKYTFAPWYRWDGAHSWNRNEAASGVLTEGTIEMWIKPSKYGGILNLNWNNVTSSPSAGYIGHLVLNSDGKIGWGVWGGNMDKSPVGKTTIPLNEWTHIAVSWSPNGTKLHVNGAVDAYVPGNVWPAFSGTVYVYLNYWGAQDLGLVDELHISKVARTDEEIRSRVTPAVIKQ